MASRERRRGSSIVGNYSMGSPYVIPKGLSLSEFQALITTWDNKLTQSGHEEIEMRNARGLVAPTFRKTTKYKGSRSGSSYTTASQYKPDVEEYYRLMGLFLHHANLRYYFRARIRIFKAIMNWTIQGYSYERFLKVLDSDGVCPTIRQKKSIFWMHLRMQELERAMFDWRDSKPEVLQID